MFLTKSHRVGFVLERKFLLINLARSVISYVFELHSLLFGLGLVYFLKHASVLVVEYCIVCLQLVEVYLDVHT